MAIENDLVLIHHEDKPVLFARIEEISPDAKPDWYHVKLLMLQVPPQVVTWILRDVYINGDEFTMNGQRMRLEKVTVPSDPVEPATEETPRQQTRPGGGQVISPALTTVVPRITSSSMLMSISPFFSGDNSVSKCRRFVP